MGFVTFTTKEVQTGCFPGEVDMVARRFMPLETQEGRILLGVRGPGGRLELGSDASLVVQLAGRQGVAWAARAVRTSDGAAITYVPLQQLASRDGQAPVLSLMEALTT